MEIPVMKKLKSDREEIEIHMLDVHDIWYVDVDNSRFVVYHTETETYFQPNNMEQVTAFLKLYQFEKLDRGMVVNLRNIKHLNLEYGKVYFEDVITKDSKYATVSYSKINKLVQLLETINTK